jgi:TolA-binding protein
MDILAFLKKDIVIFLENASTYGTIENKAIEDELTSLLSSGSISTDLSDSKQEQLATTVDAPLAQDLVKTAIEEAKEGKYLEKEITFEELGELEEQIAELNDFIKNKNLKEVLRLYNRLKLLVLTITLEQEMQGKLYTVLKDAALFLTDHKKPLCEFQDLKPKDQTEKISSLDSHEKEHESIFSEGTNTFHMPSYVKALKAIKSYDKVTALELLVSLSKQHPKNRAIKMRLREALYL